MQSSVYSVQKPLKAKYKESPGAAMVTDHAKTSGKPASDPFHSNVEPMDGCGVVVPVGFQSMTCEVKLKVKEGTPPDLLKKLQIAAERCCVVQQTLKSPPPVKTRFHFQP
jgi:hypothetical protein